jgi:D-alanyl-D-alanine carboxypeptidase
MLLALLLACSPGSSGQAERAEALERGLAAAVRRNDGSGGGVLRAEDQAGVWFEGAAGRAVAGGAAMTPTADFEIASVTKTFTAAVVLLLVEEGALSLDEGLGTALPAWESGLLVVDGVDRTPEITLRQLLNHTSGLPHHWTADPRAGVDSNAFLDAFLADPDRFWTPEEILATVPDLAPAGAPGERWHYSDANYLLLGLIVERATGSPLRDVLRARLFQPLGMDHTWTSFREDQPGSGSEEPASHRYEGSWDLSDKTHQSADWAGGGLVSDVADLSGFLRALSDGRVFAQDQTLDAMRTPVDTGTAHVSYGLGLFEVALDDGSALWGHEGHGNSFLYLHDTTGTIYTGTLNQTQNDWWGVVLRAL